VLLLLLLIMCLVLLVLLVLLVVLLVRDGGHTVGVVRSGGGGGSLGLRIRPRRRRQILQFSDDERTQFHKPKRIPLDTLEIQQIDILLHFVQR